MKKSVEEIQDEGLEPETVKRIVWAIVFSALMCVNIAGIIIISLTAKAISCLFGNIPLSQLSFNTGVLFTMQSLCITPRLVRSIHSILSNK